MNTLRGAAIARPDLPHFERILCALDVRQPAPGAYGLAGLIAERFGATLEALYVESGATPASSESEQRLNQIVGGSEAAPGATARMASGSPAREILERASSRDFDLIVLGSRQRSDLGWQFRDDVVRDVSALADCATLTVHERDTPALIERILVPVDFGVATTPMVEWAAAFALRFGAKVQLLHVVSRERCSVRSADRAQNIVRSSSTPGDATAELAELEQRVTSLGVDVASQVIVAGSTANGIESYNEQGEFDLVVMGLGSTPDGPRRLTRGVVATLRNRLSVPLLSVRACTLDGTRPRSRAVHHQRASGGGTNVGLSA